MTTANKLKLGFGILTGILIASSLAIMARVSGIEGNVGDVAAVRNLVATTNELEVHTLSYILDVRAFLQIGDPKARNLAIDDAARVERDLAQYQRLLTTDRERELAARFGPLWQELKELGETLLDGKSHRSTTEDSKRLFELRTALQRLVVDEIEARAVEMYNAQTDAALEEARNIEVFVLGLFLSGLGVALLTGVLISRDVIRGERTLAEQAERLRTTLVSIGDGVVTTDAAGRVTNLNRVAESLTGWTNAEAVGQPLDAVFRIVNEKTRQTAENPAERALRDGVVVGLANHTVLIAKDGTERSIDDSAAPIRGKEGEIVGCVLIFRDVSAQRQATRRVAESEARKTALFETSLDPIISINQEGAIVEFNAAAEGTFGHRRDDVLGRELAEVIIPPAYRERHRQGMARYFKTGEGPVLNQRLELSALRKGGAEFPVELTVIRLPVEGPVFFTAYLRDITDRKRLEGELRQTATDLSEADRRKNEFLAMLAHELRNPLAPIRNAVQVMRLSSGNEEAVTSASETMERQVNQLVRLVDDLLDVSRISRGKIDLRREQVDLSSVVNHAVEAAGSLVQEMDQELTITLSQKPIFLNADPARLAQVFGNLLNNASKFTNKGGRISLMVEQEGEQAVIRVKDEGVGIDRDQLLRIFDMFMQVDTSLERSTSGLGIGLTLVKSLVGMHDGTVEALSKGVGQGSEFVVRLPLVTTVLKAEPLAAETVASDSATLAARRILVVDDNDDAANMLTMLLGLAGHETHTAKDGLEAVEMSASIKPDIVLLDIGLPKLNGYEAARRIRDQPGGRDLILVALSGWGQEEDRNRSKSAGFNAHLVKPVDYAALMKVLTDLNPKVSGGS